MQDDDSKIALVEEHIVLSKHLKAAEAFRFHTVVHTDEEVVATPVTREQLEMSRVPLDRWVEAPIPERQEGDTTIVTLHAELVKAGLSGREVEILDGDHETIMVEIVGRGFDDSDARGYLEAVEDGKSLVAARADEDQIEGFLALMARYEATNEQVGDADTVEPGSSARCR
jgi:hypothetical protein